MRRNALEVHRVILRTALTGAHIFAWVFVFQYFYVIQRSTTEAFVNVLLVYAITQVTVALLTPLVARRLRSGYRRSLVFAILSLAAALAVLATAFSGSLGDISLGILLFAILSGVYRSFYRTPYALLKQQSNGARTRWVEVAIALMPAASGLFLTSGSDAAIWLLYGASLVVLLSLIPVAALKEAYEGFSWSYRQTFHELFEKKYRSLLWTSLLAGFEGAALLVLWPVAVFTLLDWSYPLLGVMVSLTLVFTMMASHYFGPAISAVPQRVRPLLAASGWIMRLGVGGFVGAVLVDTYFHASGRTAIRGMDVDTYEQVADNRTFVDEFTALKEIGMSIGRVCLALIAALLMSILTLPHALAVALVIVAVATGASVHMSQYPRARY